MTPGVAPGLVAHVHCNSLPGTGACTAKMLLCEAVGATRVKLDARH